MLHHLKRSGSCFLFSWLLLLPFTAHTFPPSGSVTPALHFSNDEALNNVRSVGTVRILAVMVEFQEEDNRFTTGNGTFDLDFLDSDDIIIEPLPHDFNYFDAHLQFAKNYFETVSDGQLTIEYDILPDVIQLDEPMRAYSPIGETGDENYKLANLARDAWEKAAESQIPDLSGYDQDRTMFIVFHAGSGRNIELMGTSLDKTPQDIPSVYLGTGSLQRLLDQPGFNGFDIGDPDLRVTNTALLPQTQSRSGEDVTGEQYVLQLSINGLLAANIGSFLGLPDLFNTETGSSAIGRFGLMDGASIFSYLGLFPPEPSAWEKIHLGWQQPFDITLDTGNPVPLPAVSLRNPNSIARHAISADEYFLVENRHRNPSGNPLEVTIRTPDGRDTTRFINPEDERFDPFNSSEYDEILNAGVVVNVSSFDWSLPGGFDSGPDTETGAEEGRLLNGGMLIWHIDETVIRRNIADNRVNADSDRRGVQLVEADGARDIGRTPAPGQDRFTNGHAFDFWWSGNDFTVITATGDSIIVYENRFGPDTQPPNTSNNGSTSFFEFYDFSDNRSEAYFFARSVDGKFARPVSPSFPQLPSGAGFPAHTSAFPVGPELVAAPSGNTSGRYETSRMSDQLMQNLPDDHLLLIPSAGGFYSIPLDGSETEYTFIDHPDPAAPLILENRVIAGQNPVPGAGNSSSQQDIRSWIYENGSWTQQWHVEDQPVGPGLLSLDGDDVIHIDMTPVQMDLNGTLLTHHNSPVQSSGDVDGATAFLSDDRLEIELPDGSYHYDLDSEQRESRRKYTGNLRFSSDSGPSFFLLTDNRFMLVDQAAPNDWETRDLHRGHAISWPAFGDMTNDNSLEILLTDYTENKIYGYNRDGGMLDYFPISAPFGYTFSGFPLIADITGDGHPEIITAVHDSLNITIHAFDRRMDRVEGFPLMVGSFDQEISLAPIRIAEGHMFAVSPSGEVRIWELPELGDVSWGRVYGDQPGNKVGRNMDREHRQRFEFGILNERETYNWPNPATDHTYIRFETSESAQIDITVISPGGSTIFQTQAESRGRYPEEVRLNTSSWGNGVYFGRIRARGDQGSETKIIKIVVTH